MKTEDHAVDSCFQQQRFNVSLKDLTKTKGFRKNPHVDIWQYFLKVKINYVCFIISIIRPV